MANTVTLLGYANTFGDWVVTTNALAKENNDFSSNNYVKPTGTLYLNSPSLGLQVANNAIIAGQLQVQGVGSSAYIQNNMSIAGLITSTNSHTSIVAYGKANIQGTIWATAGNLGIDVLNNARVGGQLSVIGNIVGSGRLNLTGLATVGDTLRVESDTTLLANVFVGDSINTTNDVNVTKTVNANNLNVTHNINTETLNSGSVTVANETITNVLTANTVLYTPMVNTNIIAANTSINTATLYVDTLLDGSEADAFFNSVRTSGQVTVGGNFVINGTTVYNTNTFTLSAASSNEISNISVYRSPGANASIRWNEPSAYWDILNVNDSNYYRILTTEQLTNSVTTTSSLLGASATAANTLNTRISAVFQRANTSSNTFVGTTGSASPSNQSITFNSTNGVTVSGSGSTLTVDTPQDLRTTSSPTFVGMTLSGKVTAPTPSTYTSNTQVATTAFVQNTLNSGNNFSMGIFGNATTATALQTARAINGTNFDGSADITVTANAATLTSTSLAPNVVSSNLSSVGNITSGTWNANLGAVSGTNLTNLNAANLIGTLPSTVMGNSYVYIGATAVALNRTSGSLTLNGVNIDGTAAKATIADTANTVLNISQYTINQNLGTGDPVRFQSIGVGTASSNVTGEIRATNNITAYYSDDRLKTRLGSIESALEKVATLDGFYYEANQTAQDLGYQVKKEVGLSAQQVQKVLPEVVVPAPIDEKYLTIHYDRVIPLLVEAIKELKEQNTTLRNEIEELKKR